MLWFQLKGKFGAVLPRLRGIFLLYACVCRDRTAASIRRCAAPRSSADASSLMGECVDPGTVRPIHCSLLRRHPWAILRSDSCSRTGDVCCSRQTWRTPCLATLTHSLSPSPVGVCASSERRERTAPFTFLIFFFFAFFPEVEQRSSCVLAASRPM